MALERDTVLEPAHQVLHLTSARAHRHRYHGVLAPNARLRSDVVRFGRPVEELKALRTLDAPASSSTGRATDETATDETASCGVSPARIRWAQLLARVYELDPLRCPGCHGTLRILAFLTDPPVVEDILRHLGLPRRPPRLAPARAPPQAELDFDQTPQWDRAPPDDDGTWSA